MKTGVCIKWVESIDSTNNELARRSDSIDNLSLLAARHQTAGRGQRGNTWSSAKCENLTFSLLLRPSETAAELRATARASGTYEIPENASGARTKAHAKETEESEYNDISATGQFRISILAALSIVRLLESKGIHASIKWPNDIYVGNRKICGILIENSLSRGMVAQSIIGIGLNVNQIEFPSSLMNPTSMRLQTGSEYNMETLLAEFAGIFETMLPGLFSEDGISEMKEEYLGRMYRRGQWHKFRDNTTGEEIQARICGITPLGMLDAELSSGIHKTFAFKEISYII